MKNEMNHYQWLEKHFPTFINNLGLEFGKHVNSGIYSAHGDKFYGYKDSFEKNGIHFFHGVAIGLLTYISPYSKECREVGGKWIPPINWIISNKDRFMDKLPKKDLI